MCFRKNIYKQNGVTILEILIVIIILIITAGVLGPGLLKTAGPMMRLNGAARQVQGDLMWARMQAISQNNEFMISFVDNQTFQILDDDDSDSTADADETVVTKYFKSNNPDADEPYFDIIFNPVPGSNISFDARGGASNFTTITLQNSETLETEQITISTAGRIKID